MKTNVVVYIRVSTDEQANQGYSLDYQEYTAREYCKAKSFNVLGVYREDYSAKTFERPEWNKLMSFIKSNKGLVNRIVFLKWDRFSRNQYEAHGVIKNLQKLNVTLDCITQQIDFNNPDAQLLLSICLAIPEIENTKIGNRTREGMRQAALNGCWVWKPPFGYEREWIQIDTERKNASLKPSKDAIIIKKIFEHFTSQNLSAESIRRLIYEEHGKKLSKQGVLDILTNCCYIGKVKVSAYKENSEVIVKGYHDSIIDEDIFQAAQDILSGKRRKHVRKDTWEQFPLKEIIKCSKCNLSFTASITTKNKGLNKYPYYHCSKTNGHDRYPVHVVHETFELLLKEFKVKEEVVNLFKKVVIETINSHNKVIMSEKEKIEKELEKIRLRIENAEDMLADNTGDRNVYLGMLRRYKEEENSLIMKHAVLKAESTPKNSDVDYMIELFNSFDILYKESDYKLKKQIISSIFPKPLFFFKDYFRTEEVSPLIELLILNSNQLQCLKIETSHFLGDSSTLAPQTGLEPVTL